jgi:hypothetical protein
MWVEGGKGVGQANPARVILSADNVSPMNLRFQEKLLRLIIQEPVPQTDTGGRGENLKTREITIVKELGKLTP